MSPRVVADSNILISALYRGGKAQRVLELAETSAIELCLSTFGVGNLVYGSDVPVIDSVFTLDAVRGFGDAVADALCRENPARLLRI